MISTAIPLARRAGRLEVAKWTEEALADELEEVEQLDVVADLGDVDSTSAEVAAPAVTLGQRAVLDHAQLSTSSAWLLDTTGQLEHRVAAVMLVLLGSPE